MRPWRASLSKVMDAPTIMPSTDSGNSAFRHSVPRAHHEAEDEVLWPILMERRPEELKPMVAAMEEQHQQLHALQHDEV